MNYGFLLAPFPPYSPDFNPVEDNFDTIKTKSKFTPQSTPIVYHVKSSEYSLQEYESLAKILNNYICLNRTS